MERCSTTSLRCIVTLTIVCFFSAGERSCSPFTDSFLDRSHLDERQVVRPNGQMVNFRTTRKVSVVLDRQPNTDMVAYECQPGYVDSRDDKDNRKPSGVVRCKADRNMSGADFRLPCEIECVPGFIGSVDSASCYHFPQQPSTQGVIGAALRCMEKNATLAVLRNMTDVELQGTEQYYYTLHGPGIVPANTSVMTCDPDSDDCTDTSPPSQCLVYGHVGGENRYKYQPCHQDQTLHYACMMPGACVDNFTEQRGLCYKVDHEEGPLDLLGALHRCLQYQAILLLPQDTQHINTIAEHVRNVSVGSPSHVFLGFHNSYEALSGIYAPTDAIRKMTTAADGEGPYQSLLVHGEGYEVVSHGLEEPFTSAYYYCQHPGVVDCPSPPPGAGNMSLEWDGTTAHSSQANYTCYSGHFVGGVMGADNQSATCYGQMVGWHLVQDLQDCLATDVCVMPPWSVNGTVDKATHPLHLNSSTTFTCPVWMTTPGNITVQSSTCIHFNSSTSPHDYGFHPLPEPCNYCLGAPLTINSTTNWTGVVDWAINSTLEVHCYPNHTRPDGLKVALLYCTETGWEESEPCWLDCLGPPGENNNILSNWTSDTSWPINTTSEVTCARDYIFPDGHNFTLVTCTVEGWEDVPTCVPACTEPHPASQEDEVMVEGNVTSLIAGTTLNYTCPSPQYFTPATGAPEPTRHLSIICHTNHTWTSLPHYNLTCVNSCPPMPEPTTPDTMTNYSVVALAGTVVGYWCKDSTAHFQDHHPNTTTLTSTCGQDGNWTLTHVPPCIGNVLIPGTLN